MTQPCIGFARQRKNHLPEEHLPKDACVWLESSEAALLGRAKDVADWADLDKWASGRFFGVDGEYRWRRCADGLHIVLLRDDGAMPPELDGVVELVPDTKTEAGARDTELILWGEVNRDDSAKPELCYASQIPGELVYPLPLPSPSSTRPALVVRGYRSSGKPDRSFSRCLGFRWIN